MDIPYPGRHFADDTFDCFFVNENVRISIKFSLKFVPKGPINNIPALVQIMAWRRSGDKPLYEPMMVSLLTHICVTRPQLVNQTTYLEGYLAMDLIYFLHDVQFFFLASTLRKIIWDTPSLGHRLYLFGCKDVSLNFCRPYQIFLSAKHLHFWTTAEFLRDWPTQ